MHQECLTGYVPFPTIGSVAISAGITVDYLVPQELLVQRTVVLGTTVVCYRMATVILSGESRRQ